MLDGGSTDHTVEIIKKYSPWIDFWVSEPDRGQSAAINRGLRMGSGSYATWINSDDLLCKDALSTTSRSHGLAADVVYVGDCINIDEAGTVLFTAPGPGSVARGPGSRQVGVAATAGISASRRCSFRWSWRSASGD